ncbi:MAG: crossover junction endodeoxyribonuclease RuvC [Thermodesulfobacteriota bacterium]|nr:MAG: crossover junction endodeoxyribonuclease RuvC [Thermodesulfobacteriota bacterium]
MANLRAIGVDPGLAKTGYGVIEIVDKRGVVRAWDCLSTNPKDSTPQRLQTIFLDLKKILQKWDVQLLILEDVFVLPRFPKAALQLGAVRGIVALAAAYNNLEVMELKPTEIKAALTGNGRAHKNQVSKAVQKILGIKETITSEHASDALALALVGLSRAHAVHW